MLQFIRFIPLVALLSTAVIARADVTPACLFTDHAVLQSAAAVPVWGTAAAGEQVTVKIADHTAQAEAGPDGKWSATLPAMPAGGPFTMTIVGKNTVTLVDVMVGEVWVASGQSNMQYGIYNSDPGAAKAATDSQLRIFYVPQAGALSPIDYLKPDRPLSAKWVLCTPENLLGAGNWGGFSAVGYFFGRDLRRSTGHAVGMIGSYWGGTQSEPWTSIDAFAKEKANAHYVDELKKTAARTDVHFPYFSMDHWVEKDKWNREVGVDYTPKLKAWQEAAKAAKAAGTATPPQPIPSRPEPPEPNWQQTPSVLFNAMIAPLIPYRIKGVIWYQGESNGGAAREYRSIFPLMIADWREKWGQADFPFLFVQIAPFIGTYPHIREAQFMTLAQSPNTAMAVTTDVGDASNIHPKVKEPVGHRLEQAAEALAYGAKIEYSGPIYQSVTFDGAKAILHFTHVGKGLTSTGDGLRGFTIAGPDHKFVPAVADIAGDTIVVHADGINQPTAVRYGWANVPDVNLYNKDGLPASPFRTDPD